MNVDADLEFNINRLIKLRKRFNGLIARLKEELQVIDDIKDYIYITETPIKNINIKLDDDLISANFILYYLEGGTAVVVLKLQNEKGEYRPFLKVFIDELGNFGYSNTDLKHSINSKRDVNELIGVIINKIIDFKKNEAHKYI